MAALSNDPPFEAPPSVVGTRKYEIQIRIEARSRAELDEAFDTIHDRLSRSVTTFPRRLHLPGSGRYVRILQKIVSGG